MNSSSTGNKSAKYHNKQQSDELEDDVFLSEIDNEDLNRRIAAGKQYGYTGPLADIIGAAHKLKNVPPDHDLRVLKSQQPLHSIDQKWNSTPPVADDNFDIIHKTILVGDR
jgi:hypothetical protein